jgi:hypothetical protein
MRNYAKYFEIIEDVNTDLLMSSCMLFYLNQVRKEATQIMLKYWREKMGDATDQLSFAILS